MSPATTNATLRVTSMTRLRDECLRDGQRQAR
jgi:hypothetical protein